MDTCGLPSGQSLSFDLNQKITDPDSTASLRCFQQHQSSKVTFSRNIWPLLLLWYATLGFFFICSVKGRLARNYIVMTLCKSQGRVNNERVVDRVLQMQGFSVFPTTAITTTATLEGVVDRSQQHIAVRWLPVARPVTITQQSLRPTELVLKTRIYGDRAGKRGILEEEEVTSAQQTQPPVLLFQQQQQEQQLEKDEGEEVHQHADYEERSEETACCTICFSDLEVGDRVGDLPCQHTFHVECLREWLPRRNVCPLCQNDNAATPRCTVSAATSSTAAMAFRHRQHHHHHHHLHHQGTETSVDEESGRSSSTSSEEEELDAQVPVMEATVELVSMSQPYENVTGSVVRGP